MMISDHWLRMQEIVLTETDGSLMQQKQLAVYRWLVANLIVSVFQFSGLHINALSVNAAPMWLASGAATAFIFMRGNQILPGILLGSFAAYWYAGADNVTSFYAAAIWSVQAFLLFTLSLKYISPSLIFNDRTKYPYFMTLSITITALSTLLLLFVCLHDITIKLWLNWWLANLNGMLIFAAAIYTWDYYFPEIQDLKKSVIIKLTIKLFMLFLATVMLMFAHEIYFITLLSIITAAIIFLNTYQHGWCGGMISLFIFAMTLVFASLMDINLNAEYLQVFLTISVMVFAMTHSVDRHYEN